MNERVQKVREARSIVVGAAYKIAMVEDWQGFQLKDAERGALVSSEPWWRKHREEVLDILDEIRPVFANAA